MSTGLETEILYQLMTFGIPVHSIPWAGGGTGTGNNGTHERWMEMRRQIELARSHTTMMMLTSDHDDEDERSYDSEVGEEEHMEFERTCMSEDW